MLLTRRLDEKMLILLKQGKSHFHIGGSGHEAAQIAAAKALKPGQDWAFPYYRDLAFTLEWGAAPVDVLLSSLARADDPGSGGRQMPHHYGHKDLRIVEQSSPTGSQFLQAVGTAMGAVKEGKDEVVYVSSGEGATSEGDFHEALNWSSRDKTPVIFFIQNNKYAISVPIWQQTSGASVYDMAGGYRGLERFAVDGTDFFATYEAVGAAVERARRGDGPSLVVADCVRLLAHSSSDDQTKYRNKEELEQDRLRDPIIRFYNSLVKESIISQGDAEAVHQEVKELVDKAADFAESRPLPGAETAELHVYSSKPDNNEYEKTKPAGKPIVMVDAINHALHEEMEQNPKMVISGEDIEDMKGGVFTATKGLSTKFGRERVFNSPLAESSIIGVAIGLALRGFKPVVEIQFGDYIWPAMNQIRNELATLRYRSNDAWNCPVVIRVPVGGYIHGGLYHSQNIEGFFAHLPGIRIAYPSNAADAKGLLRTAIRSDDPGLFLEHKGLYRQSYAMAPEPDVGYLLPLGKAAVKREGANITLITYGMMVQKSLEAARKLEIHGVSVEVIDIRTINPLDEETILRSVKKTNRVLVVHEDTRTGGFGAEIAAIIADKAFEYLEAPVKRIGATDTPIPFSPPLESAVLPQEDWIFEALEELARY
jgi:2-oxoisovalerate dehydrogenase E1 component